MVIPLQALPLEYEVRLPRESEIAALPAIEIAAAQMIPVEDLPTPMRNRGMSEATFRRAAEEGLLFVAVHKPSEKAVGFALSMVVDESGHLHELDVDPEHARQGLGAALVEAVAQWSTEQSFPSVTLTTFRHLSYNAPFYHRVGFREFPDSELGPELLEMRRKEGEDGLDVGTRLAMKRDLEIHPAALAAAGSQGR